MSKSGKPIRQLAGISKIIDAPSAELANGLVEEFWDRSLIKIPKPFNKCGGKTYED